RLASVQGLGGQLGSAGAVRSMASTLGSRADRVERPDCGRSPSVVRQRPGSSRIVKDVCVERAQKYHGKDRAAREFEYLPLATVLYEQRQGGEDEEIRDLPVRRYGNRQLVYPTSQTFVPSI